MIAWYNCLMRLIIGLGNPGEKYKNNRHNIGYMVVDNLKSQMSNVKSSIPNSKFQIFKTNTSMNDSGSFVRHLVSQYPNIPVSNLYIVHDDLDIPLGSYKIQLGKGPKDHKGLNSIYNELGTGDFWHVRVGIDNRTKNREQRTKGEEYVLQDFTDGERRILDRTIKKLQIDLIALISK